MLLDLVIKASLIVSLQFLYTCKCTAFSTGVSSCLLTVCIELNFFWCKKIGHFTKDVAGFGDKSFSNCNITIFIYVQTYYFFFIVHFNCFIELNFYTCKHTTSSESFCYQIFSNYNIAIFIHLQTYYFLFIAFYGLFNVKFYVLGNITFSTGILSFFNGLFKVQFYIPTNVLLWVGMLHSCESAFPKKEGGIKVLAGLAPSIQIVGSLLRTPCSTKLAKTDLTMAPGLQILYTCKSIFCH
jgi:hypothetical protein